MNFYATRIAVYPGHLRFLDQLNGQQKLTDCLKTNQSSISRRINQAVQMGLLTAERIKESYKLAKEKEIVFDDTDF